MAVYETLLSRIKSTIRDGGFCTSDKEVRKFAFTPHMDTSRFKNK